MNKPKDDMNGGRKVKAGVLILGLISVAIITTVAFSSTGYGEKPVKEYYPNGQLRRMAMFENETLVVLGKEYDENGNIIQSEKAGGGHGTGY